MTDREKLIEILRKPIFPHELADPTEAVADYLMDNGVTVQKWIPVTERLPEENGIYLTVNKNKEYEFHFFETGKLMWQGIWEEDGVTHWMPLPQPPKGE